MNVLGNSWNPQLPSELLSSERAVSEFRLSGMQITHALILQECRHRFFVFLSDDGFLTDVAALFLDSGIGRGDPHHSNFWRMLCFWWNAGAFRPRRRIPYFVLGQGFSLC